MARRVSDGTMWPDSEDIAVEWHLRYGEPTREQLLVAASIVGAYAALVGATRTKREMVVRDLKRAVEEKHGA